MSGASDDLEPVETQPKSGSSGSVGSSYSSGGGGVRLEHRVAATYLAHMLTGDTAPELGGRRVVRVSLQQAASLAVDDVIVLAARDGEQEPSLRLAVAVRRRPSFVPSDEKTAKLVVSMVQALRQMEGLVGDQAIALAAVADATPHLRQLAELTAHARAHDDVDVFFGVFDPTGPVSKDLVGRLDHFRALVHAAVREVDDVDQPDDVHVRRTAWRLLKCLIVLPLKLEEPDTTGWVDTQNQLRRVAAGGGQATARSLLERLESLTAEYASRAATVDRSMLLRAVAPLVGGDAGRSETGWRALRALDESAHRAAGDAVGDPRRPWRLDRAREIGDLLDRADAAPVLMVCGESGVGKSALALAAVKQVRAFGRGGQPAEAIALNLRQLPDRMLTFEHELGGPLTELLGEMRAAYRYLVVDAADAAAEAGGDMLMYLIASATRADVRAIVVTATDGLPAVMDFLGRSVEVSEPFVVAPLDDGVIDDLASTFPSLTRLARSERAKELLRRLVVVDLLLRSEIADVPMSAGEAMRGIWSGLVRRRERRDRGLPDAREQVMLRVAESQLAGAPAAALDPAALDGLRRDGVLRGGDDLWQPGPQFVHDELRRYAITRLLVTEGDVVGTLRRYGAPRWALSAAVLAVQIELAAAAEQGLVMDFEALQASFDALVAEGHGARWGDVPVEALLTLGDPSPSMRAFGPVLRAQGTFGLDRLFRVLAQRHTAAPGVPDLLVAEPVIELLLDGSEPWRASSAAADLLRRYLSALVVIDEAAGHTVRLRLRQRLLDAVARGEQRLGDQAAAAEAARRKPPTPEQQARTRALLEARRSLPPSLFRSARTRTARRELPGELTNKDAVALLALLGPDLGEDGAALLRRLANESPRALMPAVETAGAARALAAFGDGLLLDLSEAYYVVKDADEGSHSVLDDGVREHDFAGGILAAWHRGPFAVLYAYDLAAGIAFTNRMVNHATRVRGGRLEGFMTSDDLGFGEPTSYELNLTGEKRTYVGDDNVWRWYRGTGAGSYPCQSALMALERACDEAIVSAAAAPAEIVALLLENCENLAMPALAVGLLGRHLEEAGDALDPFLAEPDVWHLESSRAVHERVGRYAADARDVVRPERREWALQEVAVMLAANAEEARANALKAVGGRLVARALELKPTDDVEGLATVRRWAALLDRGTYKIHTDGSSYYLQSTPPAEVTEALATGNADLSRGNEATSLHFRYLTVDDPARSEGPFDSATVAADLDRVRALLENPPQSLAVPLRDLSAAVASYAVRAAAAGDVQLSDDQQRFAVELLFTLVEAHRDADPEDDWPSSPMDEERLVARALPAMLLPGAVELHDDAGAPVLERAAAAGMRVARSGAGETRLALIDGLGPVWNAPCAETGECWHRRALAWTIESMRDSAFGPWDPSAMRRPVRVLSEPFATELAGVADDAIYIARLDAALHGLSDAVLSNACVSKEAGELLVEVVAANRRGTIAHDENYDTYGAHARAVAHALLAIAADGRPEPLRRHVEAFATRASSLSPLLSGFARWAATDPHLRDAARDAWPEMMQYLLGRQESGGALSDDLMGTSALAALLPPADLWSSSDDWLAEIDGWLTAAVGRPRCLDAFLGAISALPITEQVLVGLPRVTQLVGTDAGPSAANSGRLDVWLIAILDAVVSCQASDAWQGLVDALVVAGNYRLAPYAE